jgi:hypothetical protein
VLLYAGYTLKSLHPWWVTAIVERDTLYRCNDLLPIILYFRP